MKFQPLHPISLLLALFVWCIVGLFLAVAQFAVSEGLYRLGEEVSYEHYEAGDMVYTLASTLCWPYDLVYDFYQKERIRDALRNAPADKQQAAQLVLKKYEGNDQSESFYDDVNLALGEEVVNSLWLTDGEVDLIHAAVCLAWGAILGAGGLFLTLVVLVGMHFTAKRKAVAPIPPHL